MALRPPLGHGDPQALGLLFRMAKGAAGPLCTPRARPRALTPTHSPWLISVPQPVFSWTRPPRSSSRNKAAPSGGCELRSPWRERAQLLPVKSRRVQALVGTCPSALPGHAPHFLSGEHGPAAMSGASGQVVEQHFARQILGQWDLGAVVLWDQSCPRRRSPCRAS